MVKSIKGATPVTAIHLLEWRPSHPHGFGEFSPIEQVVLVFGGSAADTTVVPARADADRVVEADLQLAVGAIDALTHYREEVMNKLLRAVFCVVFSVFVTSCVWHTEWYENGNKKSETIEINPDIQLEMKPDGTIRANVKATGEDGVERDAETIDTDNDGEPDVLWFPDSDGDMAGGGVGFPIVD